MNRSDPLDFHGLPHSLSAERMILGGVINGALDFYACRAILSNADFVLDAHRCIYKRLEQICEVGTEIDSVIVAQELVNHGELERAGGISYIAELDEGTPRLPHFDAYLRMVKDKSILRGIIAVAEDIRNQAILAQGAPGDLVASAERVLVQLGLEAASSDDFQTPEQVIMSAGSLQSYLDRSRSLGVPTGFDRLDRMTCGMRPGQLWVLAAFTSGGKSTFARNIALHAATQNYPGAFITLEMSADEVTDGLICAAGGIDSQVIRRGLNLDSRKVGAAAKHVSNLPIYIRDRACTIPQIHGLLRKLKAEKRITFAVVDYLQLTSPAGRFENRTNEVSHLSRGLKNIAVDLKIPILALSQFKRVGDVPRRPQLSDLRESGSIEQDANVVVFLYSGQIDADLENYPTEVIVAKQRNGEVGTVPFTFNKKHGVFREAPDLPTRNVA
jgi:replicative DNA helicase